MFVKPVIGVMNVTDHDIGSHLDGTTDMLNVVVMHLVGPFDASVGGHC